MPYSRGRRRYMVRLHYNGIPRKVACVHGRHWLEHSQQLHAGDRGRPLAFGQERQAALRVHFKSIRDVGQVSQSDDTRHHLTTTTVPTCDPASSRRRT